MPGITKPNTKGNRHLTVITRIKFNIAYPEFAILQWLKKMNNFRGFLTLPMVLALAGLLMMTVVAAHRLCVGASGCDLHKAIRGGSAGGRIKTGTYSYVAISQFAGGGTGRNIPPVVADRTASSQVQSAGEGR